MHTQWIDIVPAQDGTPAFGGWLATPPTGSGPAILLLQEIFGVNAHIRAVAEQYALDGYTVLAPDLFWRQDSRVDLGYVGADYDRAIALMKALQPAEVVADLQTAVAALRARPEVTGSRIGAVGYCMGGRLAYLGAALAGIDVAVAYYGGGIHNQVDLAPRVRGPILFHYAGDDPHIPPAAVAAVREAFAGHDQAIIHEYPGAAHGFNCWARAAYQQRAAALAHGRTLAFLAEHL